MRLTVMRAWMPMRSLGRLPSSAHIYLTCGTTDMCKGFDGLAMTLLAGS